MNILWIEDFDKLDSGKNTLELLFGELLSFDNWDNDLLSLKSNPSELEKYCKDQGSVHTIYLCWDYCDYFNFKDNRSVYNEIDSFIIDIGLDNLRDSDVNCPIPSNYTDPTKFHRNAGFYIFNNLIQIGIPVENICFMTGEVNSLEKFKEQCAEIYIPPAKGFEKIDSGYTMLRAWLGEQQSDYIKLRRGIINGCQYVKTLIKKDLPPNKDIDLPFNKIIVSSEKKYSSNDIHDYIEVIENFLPLREPSDKTSLYKLFIRTLNHEWEAPKPEDIRKLPNDEMKAFSLIMKITRNWIAHNSTTIFTNLTEQDISYLFICNMRAMFSLNKKAISYEKYLLSLFHKSEEGETFKESELNIRNNKIPLLENYIAYFNELKKPTIDIYDILNELQKDKTILKQKKYTFFITGLYQLFWLLTSIVQAQKHSTDPKQVILSFNSFDYTKSEFLLKFSSYIYNRSFS